MTACTTTEATEPPPGLAQRGTVMTTVTPTRQDLTNAVSLSGTVTMNPVFGLVAPVAGQMRYVDVKPPASTPTKPTRIGAVWAGGKPTYLDVPAGATFAGRLVDDRSSVTAGMPVASAKLAGYGIVADISSDKAYQIADGLTAVQAQIKNGPGPFPCTVLGTIAALPAGTIPAPPPADPPADVPQGGVSGAPAPPVDEPEPPQDGSGASGLRLVCTAPGDAKLINGAAVTLKIITQTAANALVVPVEAVAGGQGKGTVEVVEDDGSTQLVEIALGLTDGKVIEVRSGLTGTEKLSVPGPNLPPAPDADQGRGGK
ncbi:efflux RND transporter periplasmic adaptor subunit [Actinophytocola oryzae]|uniref:efflux RND transporter periplasmic adaptor subunit n=1 Tax=Actinophytocola oryzae TaxID=502181 RepID=UPI001FBBEAF7|nr:efflux RND transporter periplasmic adaptor subunit [Actinophytocola oryzae]